MTDDGEVTTTATRGTRLIAVFCELSLFLEPLVILVLVIRLTTARRDAFLRTVTAEVLNLLIVHLCYYALTILGAVLRLDLAVFILWLGWVLVVVYSFVVGIVGAIRAWRGEAWQFPLNLHLVSR
jgi:uncharacterized Tic20 family protein